MNLNLAIDNTEKKSYNSNVNDNDYCLGNQMERYSKKRQAILDCLRNTTSHPTDEWIYAQLKPEYPDLSLATVYRNLNQLKENGIIHSLGTVNGKERFDATVKEHTHAVCTKCGKTVDIFDAKLPKEISEQAEKSTGFHFEHYEIRLTGMCDECRRVHKE